MALVLPCLCSATCRVLLTGRPTSSFAASRGLHQGNPLSPYFLVLCAEGLSTLIEHVERCQLIKGVKVCNGAPAVSHSFFTDDSLIFCQATHAANEYL